MRLRHNLDVCNTHWCLASCMQIDVTHKSLGMDGNVHRFRLRATWYSRLYCLVQVACIILLCVQLRLRGPPTSRLQSPMAASIARNRQIVSVPARSSRPPAATATCSSRDEDKDNVSDDDVQVSGPMFLMPKEGIGELRFVVANTVKLTGH